LAWLVWRLWFVPPMRTTARWLLALLVWQFASGLANVVFDWPLLAAVAHTAGAAGLVIVLTGAVFGTRTAHATVSTSPHPATRLA
jgi:cytochrome c oxidase assembly protein subunit 15